MTCDADCYCSGDYAQNICDGCATKDMACDDGLECCWGNWFKPEPAVVLPKDQWVDGSSGGNATGAGGTRVPDR